MYTLSVPAIYLVLFCALVASLPHPVSVLGMKPKFHLQEEEAEPNGQEFDFLQA